MRGCKGFSEGLQRQSMMGIGVNRYIQSIAYTTLWLTVVVNANKDILQTILRHGFQLGAWSSGRVTETMEEGNIRVFSSLKCPMFDSSSRKSSVSVSTV